MIFMRGPSTYSTDVRAICRARLKSMLKKLQGARTTDAMTQAHYDDLTMQIKLALEEKLD
jgi:hypothetical protein